MKKLIFFVLFFSPLTSFGQCKGLILDTIIYPMDTVLFVSSESELYDLIRPDTLGRPIALMENGPDSLIFHANLDIHFHVCATEIVIIRQWRSLNICNGNQFEFEQSIRILSPIDVAISYLPPCDQLPPICAEPLAGDEDFLSPPYGPLARDGLVINTNRCEFEYPWPDQVWEPSFDGNCRRIFTFQDMRFEGCIGPEAKIQRRWFFLNEDYHIYSETPYQWIISQNFSPPKMDSVINAEITLLDTNNDGVLDSTGIMITENTLNFSCPQGIISVYYGLQNILEKPLFFSCQDQIPDSIEVDIFTNCGNFGQLSSKVIELDVSDPYGLCCPEENYINHSNIETFGPRFYASDKIISSGISDAEVAFLFPVNSFEVHDSFTFKGTFFIVEFKDDCIVD